MPYRWISEPDCTDPPLWHLQLWPHSSLPPQGFAIFIGVSFAMLLLPLFAVLGTPAHWVLLPFLMGMVALIWYFLRRSYGDAALREDLRLWQDRIELRRSNPRKADQHWQANPYWVRLDLHKTGGPVENYLTLKGNDRTVEIGAFLAPEERLALFAELSGKLAALDINAGRPAH